MNIKIFTVNPFGMNCYLLYDDTREAVLIDCGCLTAGEEETVSSFIANEKLELKAYLCTHYHLDHIFGNAFVEKCYGLKPQVGIEELSQLPSPIEQARRFGLQDSMVEVANPIGLTDGALVRFGNSELRAIALPGHSPGSLGYYSEEDGFVVVGDVIFAGSIGRTDLWGGDMQQLLNSISTRLFTLPDTTALYPGHGDRTSVGEEKRTNPYFR